MKLFFLVLFSALSVFAAPETKSGGANSVDDLEQRINDLEQRQKEMNEWYSNFYLLGKGRVAPTLGTALTLGGFFETAVTHIYGPDTETQTSGNSHTLGLNFSAQYDEKTKFVAQTLTRLVIPLKNLNNNPDLTPPQRTFGGVFFFSIVAQGYLEHRFSDYFIVQTGLGYIPFGITYQQREPELFRLRSGSQMIAYDDGDTVGISTPLWMGVHVYGLIPANESLGYNVYTFTPVSKQNTLGVGGRLWYKVSEKAKVGTSVQSGQQNKGSYFSHGFDLDLHYDKYGLITEYGYGNYSGNYLDSEFYYFEPYVKFAKDEWLFFLNAEFVNTPERTDIITRIPDPVKSWQYGGGFNWLPIPNARLRLTYLFHDYLAETDTLKGQERDYHTIDFSTAIAF